MHQRCVHFFCLTETQSYLGFAESVSLYIHLFSSCQCHYYTNLYCRDNTHYPGIRRFGCVFHSQFQVCSKLWKCFSSNKFCCYLSQSVKSAQVFIKWIVQLWRVFKVSFHFILPCVNYHLWSLHYFNIIRGPIKRNINYITVSKSYVIGISHLQVFEFLSYLQHINIWVIFFFLRAADCVFSRVLRLQYIFKCLLIALLIIMFILLLY